MSFLDLFGPIAGLIQLCIFPRRIGNRKTICNTVYNESYIALSTAINHIHSSRLRRVLTSLCAVVYWTLAHCREVLIRALVTLYCTHRACVMRKYIGLVGVLYVQRLSQTKSSLPPPKKKQQQQQKQNKQTNKLWTDFK